MNKTLSILNANFSLQSNYLRYAIRLMVGCTLAVIVSELLNLKNGYWVTFSVIACVFPTLGQSFRRIKQRIIGTLIGMMLGVVIAHSVGMSHLAIDMLLPIFIFLTFYSKAYSYGLFALFITLVTVLFVCLMVPGNWQIGVLRLEMTAIGAVIALATTYFIFPTRASGVLPQQLENVQRSLQCYFIAIYSGCLKQQTVASRTAQLQAYEQLQIVFETLKEASHEQWLFTRNHQHEYSHDYQNLEALYQILLLLEVHMPRSIRCEKIQFVVTELPKILEEIAPLFVAVNSDAVQRLQTQLEKLLSQVKQQRINALRDLSIPTATLSEHIQLTVFLETLIRLVGEI